MYIESFSPIEGADLSTLFLASPTDALDLVSRLLKFNPNKRISLDEVLDDPYFSRCSEEGLKKQPMYNRILNGIAILM